MLACTRDQQVGAPWSSSYNWLLSTCKLVYHVDAAPTPSQLVKWASNRQVWASKADAVVHRYKHSCKQVHFHSFTSIRRLIALHYIASSLKDCRGAGLCILFILRKAGCTTLWHRLQMLHRGALPSSCPSCWAMPSLFKFV